MALVLSPLLWCSLREPFSPSSGEMLCWHSLIKSWAFNSAITLRCDFLVVLGSYQEVSYSLSQEPFTGSFPKTEISSTAVKPSSTWVPCYLGKLHHPGTTISRRFAVNFPSLFEMLQKSTFCKKKQNKETKKQRCVCCLWGQEDMNCVEARVPGWQHVLSRACLNHWGATYMGHLSPATA